MTDGGGDGDAGNGGDGDSGTDGDGGNSGDTGICLRFVDHRGCATEAHPANPNGSPAGATGFTNLDGRFTIMMPHPERIFRAASNSWRPSGTVDWGEFSPWIQLFRNARKWAG